MPSWPIRRAATVGRDAIRELWEEALPRAAVRAGAAAAHADQRRPGADLDDRAATGAGARAQVVRRQPDGTWLRVLDQPEFGPPVQR